MALPNNHVLNKHCLLTFQRFFGIMRYACGSNDHADHVLCTSIPASLLFFILVKPPKGSNVTGTELLGTLMKTKEFMTATKGQKNSGLNAWRDCSKMHNATHLHPLLMTLLQRPKICRLGTSVFSTTNSRWKFSTGFSNQK